MHKISLLLATTSLAFALGCASNEPPPRTAASENSVDSLTPGQVAAIEKAQKRSGTGRSQVRRRHSEAMSFGLIAKVRLRFVPA